MTARPSQPTNLHEEGAVAALEMWNAIGTGSFERFHSHDLLCLAAKLTKSAPISLSAVVFRQLGEHSVRYLGELPECAQGRLSKAEW